MVSLCVPGEGRTGSPSSSGLLGEGEGSFLSLFVLVFLPLGARKVTMEYITLQCVLLSHNVS